MINKLTSQILALAGVASLSPQENEIYINFVMRIREEDKQPIYQLLKERPHLIEGLIENFHKKEEAIANHDEAAWQALLKQEEESLEKLAEK